MNTAQVKEKLPEYMKQLPKFETLEAAEKESRKRQKALNTAADYGDKESRDLANKLKDCVQEESCMSGACPVCFREHRIWILGQILPLCRNRKNWRTVTLIYYFEQVSDEGLLAFDIDKLKGLLRKQLKRAGFKGVVIGGFEMDYHKETKLWMPHFHLLIKRDKEALKKLRKAMRSKKNMSCRDEVVNRPMMVQKLKNRARQISYNHKTIWREITVYPTTKRKRNTKKYRLKQEQFVLSLKKLDQIGIKGLEFLYGVRRYGSKLKVKCP